MASQTAKAIGVLSTDIKAERQLRLQALVPSHGSDLLSTDIKAERQLRSFVLRGPTRDDRLVLSLLNHGRIRADCRFELENSIIDYPISRPCRDDIRRLGA